MKVRGLFCLFIVWFMLALPRIASAATVTWTGAGNGVSWSDPKNWSGNALPGIGDDVIFGAVPGNPTLQLTAVAAQINSLTSSQPINISGSSSGLQAATIKISQNLTLTVGTIKGATVTATGGAAFIVSGPLHTERILDGVTLGTNLTVQNSSLNVVNGLTLANSKLILAQSGGVDYLSVLFEGTQTLGGTGQVVFTGANGELIALGGGTGATAATLTIGPGITVTGGPGSYCYLNTYYRYDGFVNKGTIQSQISGGALILLGFDNQGTIQASGGGSLTFKEAGFYNEDEPVKGMALTNSGTVSITGGGTLELDGTWTNTGTLSETNSTVNLGGSFTFADLGTFNRSGGAVNLTGTLNNAGQTLALNAATGSWTLNGGTIQGGTVTASGGAALNVSYGTLDGVTLQTGVTVAGTLYVDGGLTLSNVALTLGNTVNTGTVNFQGTQTLGGTGQMIFAGNANTTDYITAQAATLTIGAGITISGSQNGYLYGVYTGDGFVNQGTILSQTSGCTFNLSNITNQGKIQASAGSSLTLANFANSGSVSITGGGALNILGGAWTNTGTISETNSTVYLGGSFTSANLGTFNATGGKVNIDGTLNNAGQTLTLGATVGSWVLNGGTIQGGTIVGSGAAALTVTSGTLDGVTLGAPARVIGSLSVKDGLTLSNQTLILSPGNVTFQGTQTLGGTGQVYFSGAANATDYLTAEGGGSQATAATLTIGAGITISGSQNGNLSGYSSYDGIVNQGTIRRRRRDAPLA